MSLIIEKQQEILLTDAVKDKPRKSYCKPQLTDLGDLRTFTLGSSSGGSFDSPFTPGAEWTYP